MWEPRSRSIWKHKLFIAHSDNPTFPPFPFWRGRARRRRVLWTAWIAYYSIDSIQWSFAPKGTSWTLSARPLLCCNRPNSPLRQNWSTPCWRRRQSRPNWCPLWSGHPNCNWIKLQSKKLLSKQSLNWFSIQWKPEKKYFSSEINVLFKKTFSAFNECLIKWKPNESYLSMDPCIQ